LNYDPNTHHRRSIRLQDYDYSQASAYFITICAHQHKCIFGSITDGIMHPNGLGELVVAEWQHTSVVRPTVELDYYVVMPNHFHGILALADSVCRDMACRAHNIPQSQSLKRAFGTAIADSVPTIVGAFKSAASRRINVLQSTPGGIVWQRNYHEHVIRDEQDLSKIRKYIANNPLKWELDRYFVK
jgi:REP element-mobilizing transposase RayT